MTEPVLHLVGVPTGNLWSQVISYAQGRLRCTVALTIRTDSSDAATVGKHYVDEINQWFVTCPNFESGVAFLTRYSLPSQCEGAFFFQDGEHGFFKVIGNGKIGVRRAGNSLVIVDGATGSNAMRGNVYAGDVFLLGTTSLSQKVFTDLLQASDMTGTASKWSNDPQVSTDASMSGGIITIGGEVRAVISAENKPETTSENDIPAPTHARKTFRLWYPVGLIQRKVVIIGAVIIAVVALFIFIQHFILARRQARIQSVLAPLQQGLVQATQGNLSRIEQERQLSDLIHDRDEAWQRYTTDTAIKRELEIFSLKLTQAYGKVSARKEIEHLPVFYDFRLITADFVASQVAYDVPGKLAVFLDANRGKLVTLSIEKKQPQSVTINSVLGEIKSLTVTDRKAYVLGKLGIYEASLPLDVAGKIVASSSANWQTPKLIGSFSDNLYVFDAQARQIWRYDRKDFSSSPSAWLKGKEGVDIDAINSMSIDGDVWMSTIQGKIYKFTRGDRTAFSYADILTPPSSTIAIYTDQSTEHLYILEPGAQRLLILDKTGRYLSSIVSKDLATATGLVVDESLKRAYVVAGSLVYEVEL